MSTFTRHRFRGACAMVLGLAALTALATPGCDTKSTLIVPIVAGLQIQTVGPEVRLTWARAPEITRVRVLRRLNAAPESPTDSLAQLIFEGFANSATDSVSSLLPSLSTNSRTYHYAVFPCAANGACENTPSRAELTPSLITVLRGGGYTIWWRHAPATVCLDIFKLGAGGETTVPNWWKSCDSDCPPEGMATARQLNATGVMQAIAIGQSFDALGIPVGRVLSSEFCRCFRTAELMDFGPATELDTTITFFAYDEPNRCANSFVRIGELPAAGTNTAIIGHAGFPQPCPTIGQLTMGEAAIFKPKGDGTADLITRVLWDGWNALP